MEDSILSGAVFSIGDTSFLINEDSTYNVDLPYNEGQSLDIHVLNKETGDTLSHPVDLSARIQDTTGQFKVKAPELTVSVSEINRLQLFEAGSIKLSEFDPEYVIYGLPSKFGTSFIKPLC